MARQMIVLKSEAEYEEALDEIEKFFEIEPRSGTPEADRFDELSRAIAMYEGQHWSINEKATQASRAQSRLSTVRTSRVAAPRDRKH